MRPLQLVDSWPVSTAAGATMTFDGTIEAHGDASRQLRIASLAKIVTAWAVLVAVEEGSLSLSTPVGQEGCTMRHLLSHAGGYGFDGAKPISPPESRRQYSNTGIELAAHAVAAATGISFPQYLSEAVLHPLEMTSTELRGSPAKDIWSTVGDLLRLMSEIIHPTLLAPATVVDALSVQYPGLAGVIPGLGSYAPCPWGLGGEIRGNKQPHWTGLTNSPQTFGHFGGSGSMLWIDPVGAHQRRRAHRPQLRRLGGRRTAPVARAQRCRRGRRCLIRAAADHIRCRQSRRDAARSGVAVGGDDGHRRNARGSRVLPRRAARVRRGPRAASAEDPQVACRIGAIGH